MADSPGQPAPALKRMLADEPYRFDFLQALRLLEKHHVDVPRLGRARRAAQEPIRLGQTPHLAFPPATLSAFTPGNGEGPDKLWVRFFGLFGPQGPLPIHLTSYAKRRLDQNKDPTFSRFADVFHHRLLLLFYRAWANSQPTVDYDRPSEARFVRYLGSLAGIGDEPPKPEQAWLHYAELFHVGYLAAGTRHSTGLRQMLAQLFGINVKIRSFVGGWLCLPDDDRLHLGRHGRLGVDTIIGAASFQRQHRFQVALGPLDFESFQRFLPGQPSLERLVAVVRRAVGDTLEWDLQLILKRDRVPWAKLGDHVPATTLKKLGALVSKAQHPCRTRLGRTSWLRQDARPFDADDLVVKIDHPYGLKKTRTH